MRCVLRHARALRELGLGSRRGTLGYARWQLRQTPPILTAVLHIHSIRRQVCDSCHAEGVLEVAPWIVVAGDLQQIPNS